MPEFNHDRTCIRCLTKDLGARNVINLDAMFNAFDSVNKLMHDTPELQDLYLCANCNGDQLAIEMRQSMWQCYNCECHFWSSNLYPNPNATINVAQINTNFANAKAFLAEQNKHNTACLKQYPFGALPNIYLFLDPQEFQNNITRNPGAYSMLTMHYEVVNLPASLNPDGPDKGEFIMIRAKFSSSYNDARIINFKRDGDYLTKHIVHMIKQIPSGYRTYDPATFIWMFPQKNFALIELLMKGQPSIKTTEATRLHTSLDDFISPPTRKERIWADDLFDSGKIKVEAAEDFFNAGINSGEVIVPEDVKSKFIALIRPVISFDITINAERDVFLRGYKLAARKFHPDLAGGDAAKMSELNMLWSQYKEVVK